MKEIHHNIENVITKRLTKIGTEGGFEVFTKSDKQFTDVDTETEMDLIWQKDKGTVAGFRFDPLRNPKPLPYPVFHFAVSYSTNPYAELGCFVLPHYVVMEILKQFEGLWPFMDIPAVLKQLCIRYCQNNKEDMECTRFEGGLIKADAVGIGSWLPLEDMPIALTEGSLIYIEAFDHIRFIPEVDPIEALELGQTIYNELAAVDKKVGTPF